MLSRLLALLGAAALLTLSLSAPAPATAQTVSCPADGESLALCIDRGPDSVYRVGDSITICVTVNVPQVLIFPAPPPPVVRITSQVNEDTPEVIFDAGVLGEHCFTGAVVPPTGTERLVAFLYDSTGAVMATASVQFLSLDEE